jgi:NAD(P)-dependent dehydrogenase (short-subunit alcohol dehydrogenase family)
VESQLLAGKVAIVTGSGQGIGEAAAIRLAAEGAAVICFDLTDSAATVATIGERGDRAEAWQGDITDPSSWAAAVDRAEEAFGTVDLLANVAGVHAKVDTLLDCTDETFDANIDVNLRGAWNGMRAVVPAMIERGAGSIINISSSTVSATVENHAAYTASKGAIEALTRQTASEYAPRGVRVNAIAPGVTRTPMVETNSEEVMEAVRARIPLRRDGMPEEIASLIAYLGSDECRYMVGAVIPVDGGMTLI